VSALKIPTQSNMGYMSHLQIGRNPAALVPEGGCYNVWIPYTLTSCDVQLPDTERQPTIVEGFSGWDTTIWCRCHQGGGYMYDSTFTRL